MQITIKSGDNDISITIPQPIENEAGTVTVTESKTARLNVAIEPALKAAGVTTIKYALAPETHVHEGKTLLVLPLETNKGRKLLVLNTRPLLQSLVDNKAAITQAISDAQAAARKAAWEDTHGPLIAQMEAEEARLVSLIPTGHIRLETEESSFDGDTSTHYLIDGIRLLGNLERKVTRHGTAAYTLPGAFAPYASRVVASISPDKLAAIRAARNEASDAAGAKTASRKAVRQAKFDEAKTTGLRVFLQSWQDDCDGRAVDCSFDNMTEWAMPDGTTTTTRTHCH